jgi:type VI protein secretion system component Hcp
MTFKAAKYILGLLVVLQFGPQCFAQEIFVQFDPSVFTCVGDMNKDFPNFSLASSVGFGATDTVIHTSAGDRPGPPIFPDIKLTKTLDDCTPAILENLAKGKIFNTVKISIVRTVTGGPLVHVLDIILTGVIITSDEFAEAVGAPSEVVTLDWTTISVTHVQSGKKFTWNRPKNTP